MKLDVLKELTKEIDAITLIEFEKFLKENLIKMCCKKDSTAKILSNNKDDILYCECCKSKLYKNGKTKNGVQKYICSNCKKTSSERTGTVSFGSNLSFEIWKNVIDNILNGFSIRRIAKENGISIDTSFRLRHKILLALDKFVEGVELKGKTWADAQYFPLNFKGTSPQYMPRISKKRGSSSSLTGISHHKLCVIGAIDENDNLIFKIGGLGKGTTNMLEECLGNKVENVTSLTTDSATAYIKFCGEKNINLVQIPAGSYSSDLENLSEINNAHSQLSNWLVKFHGVSTRHFQNYLNWFVYLFMMLKRFELDILKIQNYKTIILNDTHVKSKDICKAIMPIDPQIAYAEYNYQSNC